MYLVKLLILIYASLLTEMCVGITSNILTTTSATVCLTKQFSSARGHLVGVEMEMETVGRITTIQTIHKTEENLCIAG